MSEVMYMSEKYLDSSLTPEERAEDLLGRLSVEEKVYQISGIWAQMIDEPGQIDYGIGQVSTLEMRQKKTIYDCEPGDPSAWYECGGF